MFDKMLNLCYHDKGRFIMEALNEKERIIYDYLKQKIEKDGYSPSVRDIQSALNIKSTSTVFDYLNRLEQKGYITKENSKSRTLRLFEDNKKGSVINVPLLGKVAAGIPITAVENFECYISFHTTKKYRNNELFALTVKGESMIEAGILDLDIIIVQNTDYAENGDIVVALIDDEATVKTFYKENGYYRLQPENSTMQPIIVDKVSIIGRVVSLLRYY